MKEQVIECKNHLDFEEKFINSTFKNNGALSCNQIFYTSRGSINLLIYRFYYLQQIRY